MKKNKEFICKNRYERRPKKISLNKERKNENENEGSNMRHYKRKKERKKFGRRRSKMDRIIIREKTDKRKKVVF